ncbi:MAG TPA: DUF4214 domain-containing protein [Gemmataceae bacterium]
MNRFRKWISQRATCKKSRKPLSRRPWLESLEERVTPSVLIPVTNHRDLVFDATRDALYITTSAGTVQRWDIGSQALLSAYTVGTSLNGADITPDASALYVAENSTTTTQGFVHKVNLANGTTTDIPYNLGFLEGGVFDVVIGPNGLGLVTTEFQGSGWTPLRQLSLSTDTLSVRTDDPGSGGGGQVRQNTQISRGADRSLLFLSEANISSGPVFTYNAGSDSFSATETNTNSFIDGELSTVNRNGTLIAMELGSAVSVMDPTLHAVANLTGADGGLAFDPNLDVLYVANSTTDQVTAYDTNTWTVKYQLAIGENIDASTPLGDGVMRVSSDGKWLFLATPQGVRELALPTATGVAASVGVAGFPAYVKAGVAGTFQVTVKDPAGNIAVGYTGTVHFTSSDAAAGLPADYTFTAADAGTHTFSATLNSAGTQTITVTDTANGSLTGTQGSITVHTTATTVIPVLNRRDLVYDPVRGLLYITTTGGTVERYDVANQTLLAPLSVGNSLNGADITPQGNALYVADGQRGATQGWFRKVDLATGAVTNLRYDLDSLEGGSWEVVVGPNGIALADTTFEGSGWVPLRQITLSNDTLSVRTDDPGSGFGGQIRQDTEITRGADRSLFLFAEANISNGPLFTYSSGSDSFTHQTLAGIDLSRSITAVNRNGTLAAIDLFNTGIVVYDQNLNVVHTFSNLHGGVVFDPLKDLLYVADSATNQVEAYNTTTWALSFQMSVAEGITSVGPFGTGVMAVSNDGRFLFLNSPTGVHVFNLPTNFLAVTAFPSPAARGVPSTFTVTAEDASGNKLTGYTGTVHFSSSDSAAVLPLDYTFTAADNGVHTFIATLNTPGTQGLFATDGANAIGGAEANIVVTANGSASVLVDTGFPSPTTAGTVGALTVTAEDGSGHIADSYRGTIHFTSSDGQADLPANYTFTAADAGVHTFSVTLKTAGMQSLTSTDTVTGSITGSQSNITVNPAATSSFQVVGFPSPTIAGVASAFTVTAEDAFGNITPAYLGTVKLTSSDAQASLAGNYTFVSGDAGAHSFNATLKTAGAQSISATDTGNSGITGSQSGITVNAAAASTLMVAGFPSPSTAGTAGNFSVTLRDSFGNIAAGYTGSVAFSSSDGQAFLPGNYTFTTGAGNDNGVHTFSATLKSAGTRSLTVTDTVNAAITSTQSGIIVNPAAASHLAIQTQPSATATAGTTFAVQPVILEEDPFGNVETGDNSTHVTALLHSGSGPLQGTTTVTVSGGLATFTNLADNKAETISIDFTSGSLTKATSSAIAISPAATSALAITGFPSPTTVGMTGTFTVSAQDAFGNATPAYLGTVTFTSSDLQASLPANYTFVSGDAGAHSFSATLKTIGAQSITATDTSNSSITGSQSGITVNAAASDDGLFVSGIYHDVLGRAADAQGLANNLALLDASRFALLPSFANHFLFSGEYFSDLVNGWFQKYLGRAADPGGLAGNVAAVQGGAADEQVIANLVGSGEYFAKNGGSNLSFLQAAYSSILGRPLDPSGQTSFLGLLAAGVSRATVALDLLSSGEYRTNLVASYYSTFLGRTASSTEIAEWVASIASGMRDETVINFFVSSREYFQNPSLGGDSNQLWLTSLYQKLLNRAPDAAGLNANLTGLLNAYAAPRQAESAGLLGSQEYRTNLVNGWYQKYLGRAADGPGLVGNAVALAAGIPDEQIIANLVGSGEYFANHLSTNLGFLQAAYSDILGRALDSTGQTAFLNELASGVSRTTVAMQLLTSTEYRTNLVGGFYTRLLGRSGSSSDIAGWVAVLAAGGTDEHIVNAFLTTSEYFLRAHVYP